MNKLISGCCLILIVLFGSCAKNTDSDIEIYNNDFESGNLFVPSRVLSTTNWSIRDVGPAEMIKLTLGDYGRVLDVELPHPPDMRAFY